jgi:hypothetical protein
MLAILRHSARWSTRLHLPTNDAPQPGDVAVILPSDQSNGRMGTRSLVAGMLDRTV